MTVFVQAVGALIWVFSAWVRENSAEAAQLFICSVMIWPVIKR